jgi:hypothetical protein
VKKTYFLFGLGDAHFAGLLMNLGINEIGSVNGNTKQYLHSHENGCDAERLSCELK